MTVQRVQYFSRKVSNLTMEHYLSDTDIVRLVIYCIVLVVGVFGNTLVIIFFTKKNNRSLFDLYIVHLATADLLASLVTPPRLIYSLLHPEKWILGVTGCRMFSVIEPVTVNVSAWILTSIAHERYRGIVRPLKPRLARTRIHVTVFFIWVSSVALFIPYMYAMKMDGNTCFPKWSSMVSEFVYNISVLVLQSLLPLIIMSFALCKIVKSLKVRRNSFRGDKTALSGRYSVVNNAKDRRLILILTVAFIAFIVCSLPYNVFYVAALHDVGIKGNQENLEHYTKLNLWLSVLVLCSCCINCFIYAGLHRGFWNYFTAMFTSDKKLSMEYGTTGRYNFSRQNQETTL